MPQQLLATTVHYYQHYCQCFHCRLDMEKNKWNILHCYILSHLFLNQFENNAVYFCPCVAGKYLFFKLFKHTNTQEMYAFCTVLGLNMYTGIHIENFHLVHKQQELCSKRILHSLPSALSVWVCTRSFRYAGKVSGILCRTARGNRRQWRRWICLRPRASGHAATATCGPFRRAAPRTTTRPPSTPSRRHPHLKATATAPTPVSASEMDGQNHCSLGGGK